MSPLPDRSPGVLLSRVADRVIAHDLVAETVHVLNLTAGTVLAACDGVHDRDEAVREWAGNWGIDETEATAAVDRILDEFTQLGLVGRTSAFDPPPPPTGSSRHASAVMIVGSVHRLIDLHIRFRVFDPGDAPLLTDVDTFLGTGTPAGSDDTEGVSWFDLSQDPVSGAVTLTTDTSDTFPDRGLFLDALLSILNRYAAQTHESVALHAGAVRTPDGEVLVFPAASRSGKSTLTAAFVQAGHDYLGDEVTGVRVDTLTAVGYPKRLSIRPASLPVLGLEVDEAAGPSGSVFVDAARLRPDVARLAGEAGPIGRILLPTWQAGADLEVDRLAPHDAVVQLLASTFNLARVGRVGLDALCGLATSVPVERVTYGSVDQVVDLVTRRITPSG